MKEHITVLKSEAVEALLLQPDSTVVDATLGSGGHTKEILKQLGDKGTLIAIDADKHAIAALEGKLEGDATVHLVNKNFKELDKVLATLNIPQVDAILADLGWRMEQFRGSGKGFSFTEDESLSMTYGDPKDYPFTAKDIVNEWEEESIANVLKGYGEERFAKRIARAITLARKEEEIRTSKQLADIIIAAVPKHYVSGKVHPATRSFQALRIAVNDELAALEIFIQRATAHLSPQGRLVIITFHSLEDRIVKHAFRLLAKDGIGEVLTKKPITPTDQELQDNPRARSAKLRIFQKHNHGNLQDKSSTLH